MPKIIWILFLTISAYIMLSANMGQLDIYSLDEARNAGCAREMLERNNWIVPTFNNELRVQKPPLHYYFMMISYSVFGFGEFAARFFSVIFGVFTILATYLFAARYLDEKSARWASVVLLVSTHFSIQIHMAVPDPYLIFFGTVGTFALFVGHEEKKFWYSFFGYISLGLAILCKGPIGMVMPGLGVFLFLIFSQRFTWKNILSFRPFIGVLLMLLVALPWYFAVHYATDGAWTRAFFLEQNLERFSSPMEGHGGIFLITWAYVFIGLMPLGVYLLQSIGVAWKKRKEFPVLLFCLMAGAGILLIFSISSTKLPNYTVPLYPFWAVILGYYLANFEFSASNRFTRQLSTWFFFVLTLILPVGIYIGLGFDEALSSMTYLAYYFAFLPVGGLLAIIFLYQKNFPRVITTQAFTFIALNLVFYWLAFPQVDRENPVYVARQKMDLKKPIVAYHFFNPAFVFYAQKEIKSYVRLEELRKAIQEYPEVYVIARKDKLDSLKMIPELKLLIERKDIFEIPTTVVMEKNK